MGSDFRERMMATGLYQWVDTHIDSTTGLARVKDHKGLWGLVDAEGEEVVPCQYQEIWKFLDKGRYTTRAVTLDGTNINISLPRIEEDEEDYDDYYEPAYDYRERHTYREFGGSYAQDVEGWSDQDIWDAFDGDPDAYWNID